MSAPLHRLRKDQILKLAKEKCRHHHTYLNHYQCYLDEHPEAVERVGFFDIEASNLDADYGQVLCWCIKDGASDVIHEDSYTPGDVKKGHEDKRLLQSLLKTLESYDKIVTYFGTGFDIPFIRARAVSLGIDFPAFGTLKHKDIYYTMKSKFKLSSRRLENSCRVLLGHTDKTRIEPVHWREALRGKKAAMDYILVHCRADVLDLEKLYLKIEKFGKGNGNSI